MRIKLHTIMCGPPHKSGPYTGVGTFHPGEYDGFDDKTVHDLIAGGFAEAIEPAKVNDKKLEEALAQRRADIATVKAPPKDEGEAQPGPVGKKVKAA